MAVATNANQASARTQNGRDNGERNDSPNGEAPAAVTPFVRASDEHIQTGSLDKSTQMDGSQHDLGITDIPAYGYIRWLYLKVTATSGAAGLNNAVLEEDGPFNVLQNIALTEPNGATIVQFSDGYQLYLANKWGGYVYAGAADPKNSPIYTEGGNDGNFEFILRIPVEISARDGVGALANQDSAGQFKLRMSIAASTTVFSTAPDTLPSVRVRAWLSAWDQPEPSSGGVGNQVQPPAVGTTGFWTVQSGISVANGQNTIELKRKGNYLRSVIFVLRTSGSRATAETDWPDELKFLRDAFPARYWDFDIMRHMMFERTGFTGTNDAAGALDNGVRVHDYMHEFTGALGFENRDLWQPTRGSTRLELDGSFEAAATLDIITHDVAIAQNVFL